MAVNHSTGWGIQGTSEIVGLTITPVGSVEQRYTAKYEPPAYVKQDLFEELEVKIGQGEWVLPGTLSLPVGDGPFAAVLRYDKRTKVYPEKMRDLASTITVKEEVINDALEAVKLLRGIARVNPQHIVVLWHSLGGYLLPRIGIEDGEIAGLIVLAGLTRPLEDTILDQFTYIYSLSGTLSTEQ